MTRTVLAGPDPTLLPYDHPDMTVFDALAAGQAPEEVAQNLPASSLAWAVLAERALREGDGVTAYAFARTGYHRGLDALRRAGWRGHGPIPVDQDRKSTSELQSRGHLVCRLLLEKKNNQLP